MATGLSLNSSIAGLTSRVPRDSEASQDPSCLSAVSAATWRGRSLRECSLCRIWHSWHAGPYLCGQAMDLPLSDFRFRRNAKFSYVYDMRYWWSPVRKTTRTGSCEGSWCHVRTSLRAAEISEGTGPGADANRSVNLRHRKGIQCSSRDNLSVHQRSPHSMTPHRSIHA